MPERKAHCLTIVLDVLCLKHIKEEGHCTPQEHWNTPKWFTILLPTKLLLRTQSNDPAVTYLGIAKAMFLGYVSKHLKYSDSLEEKL